MAEKIDGWGADELLKGLWEKQNLPPSWLLNDRTPHEILYLFAAKPEEPEFDRLEYLHEANHVKRTGLPPKTPRWLMKEVPRWT